MEHSGFPEDCPACNDSSRISCIYCGHALTGEFDEHGHTICEYCGIPVWVGIGDAND
jgi:hypothetical protein